jgi:hypothetical protein
MRLILIEPPVSWSAFSLPLAAATATERLMWDATRHHVA